MTSVTSVQSIARSPPEGVPPGIVQDWRALHKEHCNIHLTAEKKPEFCYCVKTWVYVTGPGISALSVCLYGWGAAMHVN